VLAGFSMGTGEVTRYLGTYGSEATSKAVLIRSIPPYLLQADDNPQGVPKEVFDSFKQAIVEDRYAFLDSFWITSIARTRLCRNGSATRHCTRAPRWRMAAGHTPRMRASTRG
jgi:pimeloyl-ACP methyl ester carboxylesterase